MPATPSDQPHQSLPDQDSTRPRLVSDNARYAVSCVVAVVLAAGYGLLVQSRQPEQIGSLAFYASVYFGTQSVLSLVCSGLTWRVLRSADGSTLRYWLTEDRARRRRRRVTEWLTGSGGPLGAVSLCALAIGAVVAAAILPELREDPLVIALAVAVVVTSWLLIVIVFTVHYAREDARLSGLEFPGADRNGLPRFGDYWYLAVQASTTYNSADVKVTGRHLRRALTAHAVVAFVYNTVLIALLVSLLITIST